MGNHVSQAANDKQEVEPALNELDKVADELGKPEALVADAGYHSKDNVERCVEQDIPYIAGNRERHNRPLEDRLNCTPECPADADAVTAMKHRLQTAEGKAIYSKRKSTVETVFGVIKEVLGFRRFHLRGLRGAEGEWSLVCTAWNLKRMYAWQEDKWGQWVPTRAAAPEWAPDTLEGVAGVTIPPERPQSPPRGPVRPPEWAQPSAGEPAGRLRRSPGAHFVTPRPRLRTLAGLDWGARLTAPGGLVILCSPWLAPTAARTGRGDDLRH